MNETDPPPFGAVVTSIDELRGLHRDPSTLVRNKKKSLIDEAARRFIETSPFLLVATADDGGVDVSPRGGDPGFVRVLDDRHVAIPDLNGNNLLDSMTSVVTTGRAGLLFVVPGIDETLRLNGAAWVSTDVEVLGAFSSSLRTPKVALVVRADEVFVHCAKAFRRGHVWDPASWAALAGAPDGMDILCSQKLVDGPSDEIRAAAEAGYAKDLAKDRPA
jgi:PPOX class probable FMN-dependent enzyme